jgi:branched-chain amino acid aminotransferase
MLRAPMANLCNLDGEIVPEAAARIPVLDRGFLFGDSIYEVVRTRGGAVFGWREHLQRLRASADGIGLLLDLDDAAIVRRIDATLRAAGNAESYVRLIVTRGTGSAPSIDLGAAPGPARWIVLVRDLPPGPATARLQIIARLRNDRRALDPAIKSGNYLNNVLGLAEAKAAGATDCLFLDAQGHATEASTSNVFALRGGRLLTPPLGVGILAGVTRALLIDFCRGRGDAVAETDVTADAVRTADEVFLSSTLRDVTPVTHVDGAPVRDGRPGPFAERLRAEFATACDRRARDQDGPAWRRAARVD